jgi:hypothetical protein
MISTRLIATDCDFAGAGIAGETLAIDFRPLLKYEPVTPDVAGEDHP